MKERTNKDPEIYLIAWKGSCSQLAAQFGIPLEKFLHELNQLPKYKQGSKLCFDINAPNATNHLKGLIQRRRLKSVSE